MEQKNDKTTTDSFQSENGRATGGMPEVRGNGDASKDHLRGNGLSGVQPSNAGRNASKIFSSTKSVGKDLLNKVNLLNAYMKLFGKGLPSFKDATIDIIIQSEYRKWVQSQIDTLIGIPTKETFTESEITALKALSKKILDKSTAPPQPPQIQQPAPNKKPPMPNPNAKPLREPLKESVNLNEYQKSQVEFLRQLELMDRNAPET